LENKKPPAALRPPGDHWSGEATRTQGFAVEETRVDVMIGDDATKDQTSVRKERPIWMTESTIITQDAVMVRMQISLLIFSSLLLGKVCPDLFVVFKFLYLLQRSLKHI